MTQEFIECPRCGSKLCLSSTVDEMFFTKACMGCGFETDSSKRLPAFNKELYEEELPYLYRDLAFTDEDGSVWYPSHHKLEKGLVFVNGTSSENWNWCGILKKEMTEEELQEKTRTSYVGDKTDRKSMKKFETFLEAMSYAMFGEELKPEPEQE